MNLKTHHTALQIKNFAKMELVLFDEKAISLTLEMFGVICQMWKLEFGNKNPIIHHGGLLDAPISIPYEKAEPWECADFISPSRIKLFLKLYGEKNTHLDTLFTKVNPIILIAALIDQAPETQIDDLYSAKELIVRLKEAQSQNSIATLLPHAKKGIKFKSGRTKGSLKPTNKYLKELSASHPSYSAKQLFQVALKESNNGKTPFGYDHADGGILLDGDNEVNFESFERRLSKAKNNN